MTDPQFDYAETATAKLMAAITDDAGELLPIDRIELEPLDGGQVRWNVIGGWTHGRRLYSSTDSIDKVDGYLAATKMLLVMRAGAAKERA